MILHVYINLTENCAVLRMMLARKKQNKTTSQYIILSVFYYRLIVHLKIATYCIDEAMSDLHEPLLGPESKETEPCFAAVCVDDKLEMNDRTIVWIETQESSSESKDKWSNIVQQSLIFVVCLILGFFIAVSTLPQVSFPMNFSSSNVVQEPNLSDSSDLSQGIYSSYVTSINSKDDFHSFLEENDVVFVNFFVSLSKFR